MRASALAALVLLAASVVPAHAAEKVELRAGAHEGYGRIAIEWPKPVAYDAKLEGNQLVIHFARPFTAQLNIIDRNLGAYVSGAAQSADGTTITAKLRRAVALKTMVVDQRIVAVDLVAQGASPAQEKPVQQARNAAPEKEKRASKAKAAPPEKASAKTQESQPPSPPAPTKSAALEAQAQAAPLALVPPAVAAKTPAAAPTATTDTAEESGAPVNIAPLLVSEAGQTSLRFDWPVPTAAAVYRRGSALWLVFAASAKLDLDKLRAQSDGVLSAIDVVPTGTGTALRLVAADGLNPSVRRDGTSWIIDLKDAAAAPDAPITVDPRPTAMVPSVELHVHQAAAVLPIRDPVIGDRLLVVPVAELGRGVDATRSFVDFRLLQTVQGVVIRPNADDLTVNADTEKIAISRPHGLALSGEQDRMLGGVPKEVHRLFDFAAWHGPDSQSFIERRSKLERAVADVPPAARTVPRLDLARFYFANLFGAETLGVLAQIERDDAPAAADRNFLALKGAACFLAEDKACAQQIFGASSFDNEPEAMLWRAALAADTADWNSAARQFIGTVAMLSTYPKPLRDRFALMAAESLVETERGSAAGPLIDMVLKGSPTDSDRAMAEYLFGRREQQLGELEPALEEWVKVAASGDRRARARALYARAMALYDSKKASRLDTINALDALRFSWRGDAFEFTLLRQLGELQLAEGDIDGGIEALHEAAVYFPSYPAAKDAGKEAADSFATLFLGKRADDLPPVKALALYTEFQDLEPAGERHDAIVRKLIDRLVSVDLLEQATTLLEDQVKNHLGGRDKARGATQLALLRLMNRQPDAAVAALDLDVGSDITPDLARQRQELRARALTDLNKAPEALALLQNDNSVDAARLRADIYWRQQDWKDAAKTFADLAGTPPAQGPLGVGLSRIVLAWAAALTLDGDQDGIAKLRESFGAAMAGTQTAQAFNLITEDNSAPQKGGNAGEVAARIAEIGALQNFMTAYRERLASDGLNAAVN